VPNQVNQSNLSYRPEIDGLRAIAVMSVILYHARMTFLYFQPFQGGFIGVDIFFVISGYLISRIVLSEVGKAGSLDIRRFYERRARRILPALYVVICFSIPCAWMLLLPSALVEYAQSVLAALFFVSNLFFYEKEIEYGATEALLRPLLHTWSLGVEAQFYLFFPW
jgi:peptidoglycan/LPS O-acetylase OafA/YrhL